LLKSLSVLTGINTCFIQKKEQICKTQNLFNDHNKRHNHFTINDHVVNGERY
jgi:hypothetical protein